MSFLTFVIEILLDSRYQLWFPIFLTVGLITMTTDALF